MRYGAEPTQELVTLSIAKQFGILPEEVEEKMSKRWYDIIQVVEQERQRE